VQDGLQVWGSENQLVQVFVNILSNAGSFVQAANKRGDVPTVTVTAQSSSGGTIVVSVHDNGSGIPPADLGRVFEPFFTSRDVGAGMGLGLSICHQICQSHSASLEAHSELGAWTEFTLCFPPLSYFKRGSNS
jgi:two-component system, sensor histidine kinase PhcS